MTNTLVICGHGMVGQRLLERLCEEHASSFSRVVVFSGEPTPAYNRILLSSLLAGEASEDSLTLKPDDWFQQRGIECRSGDPVTRIDRGAREVITASGHRERYSKLVIATGSRSASLGLPGEGLRGVVGFRDLRDTQTLIELSQKHRRAVVIGGGFLGLEAAEGLRCRGMSVTVLHRSRHLLNRQLDRVGGTLLAEALQQRGLTVRTGTTPIALLGNQQLRAVQLDDETLISTDLVVVAAGITPNAELAREAGLACDRGILVNHQMQTSDPDIYALGECCQLGRETFGLVEPGYEQAEVLARILSGQDTHARFEPSVIATRLKISGIPIFSSGQTEADDNTESVVWQDYETNRYCRLMIRDQRLTGAVLFGETSDGPWYHDRIRHADDITEYRANLAFGKDYCNAAA
ncbi:NAD(P)/FAD-dependent oxidoreductase [Marinobacter zhejiangensis]|uniref:Assimilatory nitrate reductase (NADH) beta subunit n=1 Tax=Marinobacter zhejiangensis TaxID=488535 RepID=A0A1I4M0U6_9GAMM|nr:FAD-dependent oxidoreductase [Marinobacter zhejiangensis]SFL96832.1 assimilatory nitrate reductase (NADH) beta subunit [Marinobacter zhejiangensis]